ncbi:MAG: DUF86 domain-containing protein [Bacteroidia bacterium]
MRDKIGDSQRLFHIKESIEEIEKFTKHVDFLEFESNSMMRLASIKLLEIIGEAANALTTETRNNYSEIEWKQIIALRNILVHEYFGIDSELVWQIIKVDLPHLKEKLKF